MVSFADLEGKRGAKPGRPGNEGRGKPGRREQQHVCHGRSR
jgi:hypothetical protein